MARTAAVMWAVIVGMMNMLAPVEAADIPCPDWEGGLYINQKCFKIFPSPGDWYKAGNECEGNGAQLAEPRTAEEAELLLEMGASQRVWIGVKNEDGAGGYRLVSDNTTADSVDVVVQTQVARPSCVFIDFNGGFYEKRCLDPAEPTEKHACEKGVSETYVISSQLSGQVTMDVAARENATDSDQQELVVIYRDGDSTTVPQYHVFNVSGPSDVKTLGFSNFTLGEWKPVQSKCVEVVTSHPMTLTLWYDSPDHSVSRFLLHPFLHDLGRTNDEPRYYIASTSLVQEYFIMSVVSRYPGVTDVVIDFTSDPQSDHYLWVDSVSLVNPKSVQASLDQYHSLDINGTLVMDGIEVTASQEVAVYVIILVYQPEDNSSHPVMSVHQALPMQVFSYRYITFPSNATEVTDGYDIYKAVATMPNTDITIFDVVYSLPEKGSVLTMLIPNAQSYLMSGNRRFLLYRVFNASTNDLCSTPLITRDQWQGQYTLPTQWMSHVTRVTLHVIIARFGTDSVYLDDAIIGLACSNVTGSDDLVACLYQLTIPVNTTSLNIRASTTFGAYLVWVSGGSLGCQALGQDWYGDWQVSVFNHQEETTTTTTTLATTITITTNMPPITTTTAGTTTTTTTATTESGPRSTDTSSLPPTSWSVTPTPTSTTTESIPMTTTSSSPEPQQPSNLTCSIPRSNVTKQELDQVVEKIQQTLQVDSTKTSSFVRSKTSAKDHRPSSTGLGYGGIAFVVILLASVIISDVITCFCRPSRTRRQPFESSIKDDEDDGIINILE